MAERTRCGVCDGPFVSYTEGPETMVGFVSLGLDLRCDHDDNCRCRIYYCGRRHETVIHTRNVCPNPDCDWMGQSSCFCHKGEKMEPGMLPDVPCTDPEE